MMLVLTTKALSDGDLERLASLMSIARNKRPQGTFGPDVLKISQALVSAVEMKRRDKVQGKALNALGVFYGVDSLQKLLAITDAEARTRAQLGSHGVAGESVYGNLDITLGYHGPGRWSEPTIAAAKSQRNQMKPGEPDPSPKEWEARLDRLELAISSAMSPGSPVEDDPIAAARARKKK